VYSSPSAIRIMKSVSMKLAKHSARMVLKECVWDVDGKTRKKYH
jgi:hypothetical protein